MGVLTDAQRIAFESNGYLILHDVLSADELAKVRAAANRAEDRWRADLSLPGYREWPFEEIDAIMEYDDVLFDLVEHPQVFPYVHEVLGPDVQLIDHAYYMTGRDGALNGSAWHTDLGNRIHGIYRPRSTLMVRAIFALEDIGARSGPTLVLPGSHRYPDDFDLPQVSDPVEMPGSVALECAAGSAYIYNGNLLHAPSTNRSNVTRRVLLFNYGHRWMRMWRGHGPSAALIAKAGTPMRQQLIGQWRAYYGTNAPLSTA
ncbi:MAG: hypothetical protein GKR94_00425 [Gammaproteobacteria bacterium]|nr:hypothetical protein [Gammaproteobacteria bacterium]